MTMSMPNNSSENFSRQVQTNDDAVSHNNEDHKFDHLLSANYSNSAEESLRTLKDIPIYVLEQREIEALLKNSTNEERNRQDGKCINRSPVIGQSGCAIASVTDNNNVSNVSNYRITATHNNKPASGQLDYELTECGRGHSLFESTDTRNINRPAVMGQKNTKGNSANTISSKFSSQTPSSKIQTFHEPSHGSYAANNNTKLRCPSHIMQVPTITVDDCSSVKGQDQETAKSYESNITDKDEFYDFEIETPQQLELTEQLDEEKECNYAAASAKHNSSLPFNVQRSVSPTSLYSRYNYMKLEDVEEEDEDEDEDDNKDGGEDEDEEAEYAQEAEHATREQSNLYSPNNISANNLDSEFTQYKCTNTLSPERHQQLQRNKSTNMNISKSNTNTDYNLSSSFPDSGMGESLTSSHTNIQYINTNDADCDAASSTMKEHQQQQQQQQQQHIPFIRDGYSTDCDETLMQCDELLLDFAEPTDYIDPVSSERLVCIESISLPDVVVESTNSNGNNSAITSTINNNAAASSLFSSKTLSSSNALGNSDVDRSCININGATGATLNSIHFIPIHVEDSSSGYGGGGSSTGGSGRSSPRKPSVDDSLVGSSRAAIEIVEDVTELQQQQQHSPSSTRSTKNLSNIIAEKLKNDLLEQKAQFNVQLEDAHKSLQNFQTKINEMQIKVEKLEQELSAKTWNVERLQGELNAAQKDDEYVRKKLKLLEDEKTILRHRYSENEDELKRKYDDLDTQYNELQDKYRKTQTLASSLHTQLAKAQTEAEQWREEVDKIRNELEEEIKVLQNSLENSENERKICEDRWQREFEMLRTHNMDREESIMTDCEWQLRQMQRQCKDKIDKAVNGRNDAEEKVEQLEEELEGRRKEIDDLRIFEAQVNSLRGVVNEQDLSMQNLVSQIELLKGDLAIANENLGEQIEAVKKIKYHCDNALYDKDRQMIYRIDEVRNEAAAFWENKLYTEMTRLKNELESVYVDERRDALDKLQMEHVEELKALTNRYSDNEEELRVELSETQQRLEQKTEEFIEFREKSDNSLLQTRMHLDRADREYQKAMCQEEERRETLENNLRQEFQSEKHEMEEKFRERLNQVKDEFAKELQINTQELTKEHEKEIEKLKANLQAEKDEALQALNQKHRKKLADQDEKIKNIEQRYKNDLKDLKAAYYAEKAALDKRDISNANEIEQLHRKCRCLTNLFEEMRMRYERRDPRAEDLREISELRTRCESQERDLYLLTDRLREMQIKMNELQQNGVDCNVMNNKNNKKSKQIKKPPPKTMPTNCDVIYEENEERDSPPPAQNSIYTNKKQQQQIDNNYNNEDDDDDDDDDEEKGNDSQDENKDQNLGQMKNIKLLIKDNMDDSHMITAV